MEGDHNGRQSKWKTTIFEHDQNGRQPQRKTISIEDDIKEALQEADDISLPS